MQHAFDWTVQESTELVKDAWISLRADTCRMPDGRLVSPYYVLDYPTWVNVVALTDDEEIILVRQYRHGIRRTVLELPCGGVDEQDASPLAAIQRELLEETGYTGETFVETGKISPNTATHSNTTHCFLATSVTQIQSPILDATEQLETVVLPLEGVFDLIRTGEFCQALHISALFLSLQKFGKTQLAEE
ncbi:MAG: NUDIX hydrolase [bacterium]|nr:NUDIX hydrolase [bacterium]